MHHRVAEGYGRVTPLIVKAVQDLKMEGDTRYTEFKAANDNIAELQNQVKLLQRTVQQLKRAR